ncbi:MAG: hypothetical protein U5O16_14055 [Rhodococcus sp. (in: high G+C Gram-positive bacteria)]|uniref:HNH endonuclease n=1 Tax=Rhodococcus sp. TaxID=1831 RepID=UPI002AD6E2B3|nr:hypothetical protein [Rhodococcus sp. (in: high G+C Gram-positive bacteria)]
MTMFPKTKTRTGNAATYQVRYRPGDSDANAILRVALLKEGKDRCYLCKTRVTFAGSEIDHIVPRTISPTNLELIKEKHLTPAQAEGFGLHLAHNLAPICTICNSTKLDSTFEDVPALTLWLKMAHKRQAAVEKSVTDLRSESGIKKAMSNLLAADLSSATAQECLLTICPAVIDRLRSEVPAVLEGPSAYVFKGEYSDHGWDEPRTFAHGPLIRPIVLDEGSRRAKIALEEVFRWDFDESLDIAIDAVKRAVKDEHADQLRGSSEEESSVELDSVEAETIITVNDVRIEEGIVIVRGSYESKGSAAIAIVDYQNDSGTTEIQKDVESEGEFEVALWGEQLKPEAGDVFLY